MASLCSGEYEQWTLHFVGTFAGLQTAQLVAVIKADDQSLSQLLQAITGLPISLRLNAACGIKGVLWKALRFCALGMGSRFAKFTETNGLRPDGTLNWKKGAYELQCSGKKITKVKHILTKAEVDLTRLNLDTSYRLQDNFSDHTAALVKKPLPPVRLISLFDSKQKAGPHSVDIVAKHSKPKAWAEKVDEIYAEWLMKKDRDSVIPQASAQNEAKKALDVLHHEKRQRISQAARDKAAVVLQSKRLKRTIQLETPE